MRRQLLRPKLHSARQDTLSAFRFRQLPSVPALAEFSAFWEPRKFHRPLDLKC